nr:MAG TPA: hypothetical protein [Caudoviricetes sp.]
MLKRNKMPKDVREHRRKKICYNKIDNRQE